MAHQYKLRWKIPFQTFMGEQLEVQIEQDGWTGGVTTISDAGTNGKMFAAARPFETKGQTDTDIFKPIRTQSGYIRVVCKDESWRDLIPTNNGQNRVKLIRKVNNQVLWLGFMKAEMYKHTLYEFADTYEFPIICPLTLLKQKNLSITNTDCSPFYEVLQEMFEQLDTPLEFEFQNTFEDRIFLDACVNRMAWLQDNDEYNVNQNKVFFKNKDKCFDILEQYCKFWGFTCEMDGETVTFTANDMRTADSIQTLIFRDVDLEPGSESTRTIAKTIIDEQIIDNASQEEITLPPSLVKVQCTLSKSNFDLGIPDWTELLKSGYQIRTSTYASTDREGTPITVVKREVVGNPVIKHSNHYEEYPYTFQRASYSFFDIDTPE